jgi:GxxExxY protein
MDQDPLTAKIIGAAIEVHRRLGPGLLESAYQACLGYEFEAVGLGYVREVVVPVEYRGHQLDCCYRLDFVVEGQVVLEIKCVEKLAPIHEAQLITYLRLTGIKRGLLMNFNVPVLREGIVRRVL